jgi:hypothetical protein
MGKLYSFHGWICGPTIYEYDGWLFEFSRNSGPWPLKKGLELRKNAGRKFYNMFAKFDALPDLEKAQYKVGGGCQRF